MKKIADEKLTEYDLRQIVLMRKFVISYMNKEISLKKLIDNLEGLYFCLESVDNSWKEKFHNYWFELEETYALALCREENIDNYSNYINKSIAELKKLLGFDMCVST